MARSSCHVPVVRDAPLHHHFHEFLNHSHGSYIPSSSRFCCYKKIPRCHSIQMSTQPMQIASPASHSAPPNSDSGFTILKEELCYSRYLNVYNRIVEHPPREETAADSGSCTGKIVQYDIVGSKTVSFHFCAVFPYDTLTRSVTLIKEYAQGGNCYIYGVPCGGLSEKHLSLEDCARKELSEEAQLQGGNLVKLISDDHPGLLEVKWCRNRFTPFILLDPERDAMPRPMDPEEVIEVLTVDIPTLKEIMYGGTMMLPSVVTCSMALKYLQDHDFLNSG